MSVAKVAVLALSLGLVAPLAATAAATATKSAKSTKPAKAEVVHFIADDLDRALAEARKTQRPIFVESWAPW